MALEELSGPQRDGTAQVDRARAELDPASVGLDERTPAELIAFAQRYAGHLLWRDADDATASWAGMFAGLAAEPGPGLISHAEAAAFAANPAAFAADRFAALRRPHLMLFLAFVRLLRHGQDAINAVGARHYEHHLRDVLRLAPLPAVPDRAHVLLELAANVAAAEAPAGLRLLAGRDARRRDRVYRLDDGLVVNRARVARLATSFVDREVVDLAGARDAEPGTPEDKVLALLRLAYGDPRPGDPLPDLRGAPLTLARLQSLGALIAFSEAALFLQLFELRAMLARKARRDAGDADWALINTTLEAAGRAKRGQPDWTLNPANPRDFRASLLATYDGDPMLNAGLPEVETFEDLALHAGRADVQAFVRDQLFLKPAPFAALSATKQAIDRDHDVINRYLEAAGRTKRGDPNWPLPAGDPADFNANLAAALGAVDYAAAGPEGAGIGDPDAYLARLAEVEAWFGLPAEEIGRLVATLDDDDASPAWGSAAALLAQAHARKVRDRERDAMRRLREAPPPGKDGLRAALAEAVGDLPPSADPLEALARYATADEVELVRAALNPRPRHRVGAATWVRIDGALAEARRKRLRLPEPVARREHWRALWADADPGKDDAAFRAFGAMPPDAGPDRPPAAIGWAIASPALALTTGRRRIAITLAFDDDRAGPIVTPDAAGDPPLKAPFAISLSAGKEWLTPTEVSFATVSYDSVIGHAPLDETRPFVALQIAFTLEEADPPTAPPLGDGFAGAAWPVLRLLLRPAWDGQTRRFDTAYERYRTLRLARAHVGVTIGGSQAGAKLPGLWPLTVETEAGPVDGKKPFEPFGQTPVQGSEVALGHRDLLHKKLLLLSLRLQWQGLPGDLAAHYANYPARDFKLQPSLVDGRVRTTPIGPPLAMFPAAPSAPHPLFLDVKAANASDPVVEPLGPAVRGWRRHLVLALAGTDFGHQEYPGLAASKAVALAAALRAGPVADPQSYVVKPPFAPKLKRIELDVLAAHEVELARYDRATAVDRLYHVHPFGIAEAPDAAESGWPLLPSYEEEGALHIGLDRVAAPQTLSLLVQSVAAAGAEDRPRGLAWSYLDAAGWVAFAEPPRDDTLGLARPGLVRFTLPEAAPDGRMPAGFYWLRATLVSGAAHASDLVGVHAQAAVATFVDDDAPPEHYAAPLPAKSIRAIGDAAPGLARVVQPYPSVEGRPPEDDAGFRVRAGERLRHKGRALAPWDYERLTLARFPAVHKVKCLPASVADDAPGLGAVRLVIVPDVRGQRRADPFAPRAPAALLDEVAAYLVPLAPVAARVSVGHPRFVRLRVRVGVRFRARGDEAFDKRRLNDALNRHLAPWAYDEGADIAIGQRIDATSIVAFIDRLPFVDFVAGCRLFMSDDGGASYRPGEDGGDAVEARQADAILTPAGEHEIDVIGEDVFAPELFTGIGYMKLELDFVVG